MTGGLGLTRDEAASGGAREDDGTVGVGGAALAGGVTSIVTGWVARVLLVGKLTIGVVAVVVGGLAVTGGD